MSIENANVDQLEDIAVGQPEADMNERQVRALEAIASSLEVIAHAARLREEGSGTN